MTTHKPDSPVPAAIADRAGLCYVHDSEPGYQRKRWGRGFTFLDKTGNHITDKKKRQRLEALARGQLARVLQDIQAGKIKHAEELSEIETAVLALLQS